MRSRDWSSSTSRLADDAIALDFRQLPAERWPTPSAVRHPSLTEGRTDTPTPHADSGPGPAVPAAGPGPA